MERMFRIETGLHLPLNSTLQLALFLAPTNLMNQMVVRALHGFMRAICGSTSERWKCERGRWGEGRVGEGGGEAIGGGRADGTGFVVCWSRCF